MGNETSLFEQQEHKFGSYKDAENPRPGYHKTPKGVFYRGKEINANLKTFEKIGSGWAKDHKNVFYAGKVIKDADANTFRKEGKKFKDVSGIWVKGKLK